MIRIHREFNKNCLPVGVQIVIDSSYEEFKYAEIYPHCTILHSIDDECYAIVAEEAYNL